MKKIIQIILFLIIVVMPFSIKADPLIDFQEKVYHVLKSEKVISPETKLVLMSYVCSLNIDGNWWPVIDVQENIHGAQVPRGHNQIIILDDKLNVRKKINYSMENPRSCQGNKLFLHDDLAINNMAPSGNILAFDKNANIKISSVDINELPMPITKDRKSYY